MPQSKFFYQSEEEREMKAIQIIRVVFAALLVSLIISYYDKWNNIPHHTQTETNGRGPCEPSLTSEYAHHSLF